MKINELLGILSIQDNREDAPYNNAVQFPTSRPFYLLIFTFLCQMIQGMNIQNESVESDDKDDDIKTLSLGNTQWGRGTGETSDCDIVSIRYWAESNKDYLAKLEVSLFQIY